MLRIERVPVFVGSALPTIVENDIAVKLVELRLPPRRNAAGQVVDDAVDKLHAGPEDIRPIGSGDGGRETGIVTAQASFGAAAEKFDILKSDVIAKAGGRRVAHGNGRASAGVESVGRASVRSAINSRQLTRKRLKGSLRARIAGNCDLEDVAFL